MAADKRLQLQVRLSNAGTEEMTCSFADMERVTIQLMREIFSISSNEPKLFQKGISIRLIKFETWWETISIQARQKTTSQCDTNFGYPKMHLVSHILESIH